MSHPHIIDSLLAIRRFFEWFIITIVGPKPAKPEIAERVISDLLKDFIEDKSFFIILLLFLNLFLTRLNTL